MMRKADGTADPQTLAEVRASITDLDRRLLALAAERLELARREGELRRLASAPVIDPANERVVLEAARRAGRELGLDAGLAEELIARLLRAAWTAQEEDSLRHAAVGAGRRAVVVGGAGRMGRWTVRFLEAQGYAVAVLDPALPASASRRAERWLRDADLVICAAPPRAVAALYREWCAAPPAGVIADLASVKTPLVEALGELQAAGARVASFHPMFGPSTVLLRGADVLLCDTGDAEAMKRIEALFRPTTARPVRVALADHDRLMADLLSLAHAASIAFAAALPASEHPVRSTTFQALEDLAARVVQESPDVYYEIQTGNPHSLRSVERLAATLEALLAAVRQRRPEVFRRLMQLGRSRTTFAPCHWSGPPAGERAQEDGSPASESSPPASSRSQR